MTNLTDRVYEHCKKCKYFIMINITDGTIYCHYYLEEKASEELLNCERYDDRLKEYERCSHCKHNVMTIKVIEEPTQTNRGKRLITNKCDADCEYTKGIDCPSYQFRNNLTEA